MYFFHRGQMSISLTISPIRYFLFHIICPTNLDFIQDRWSQLSGALHFTSFYNTYILPKYLLEFCIGAVKSSLGTSYDDVQWFLLFLTLEEEAYMTALAWITESNINKQEPSYAAKLKRVDTEWSWMISVYSG